MFNLLNGFTSPTKEVELKSNIEINVKDYSLANIENDLTSVTNTLIENANSYMDMLENGSLINVMFLCFTSVKMYNEKLKTIVIDGKAYTKAELDSLITSNVYFIKNREMKSRLGKLFMRRLALYKAIKQGHIMTGFKTTIDFLDANFEIDGRKKIKNNNEDTVKGKDKKASKDTNKKDTSKTVNSVDTSNMKPEEVVESFINACKKELKMNDLELYHAITKHFQKIIVIENNIPKLKKTGTNK